MTIQTPFEDRRIGVLAWNFDSSRIAIATSDYIDIQGEYVNHLVRVLNSASNQIDLSISFDDFLPISHISWCNNDSELLVANIFGEVKRFNAVTGSLLGEWTANVAVYAPSINPLGTVLTLVISPTFPSTVTRTNEQILTVYDVLTGTVQQSFVLPLQPTESVHWTGWSPDGSHLAVTDSKGSLLIYLWNGTSLAFQHEIAFATNVVGHTYAAWGPDSRQIAVTASDKSVSGIVIYNTETGSAIRELNQSLGAFPIAWNVGTNLIAAQAGSHRGAWTTRIWNGITGQIVEDVDKKYLSALAWSPNGTLATGGVIKYDEWLQDPTITGVSIYRPKHLPPL